MHGRKNIKYHSKLHNMSGQLDQLLRPQYSKQLGKSYSAFKYLTVTKCIQNVCIPFLYCKLKKDSWFMKSKPVKRRY